VFDFYSLFLYVSEAMESILVKGRVLKQKMGLKAKKIVIIAGLRKHVSYFVHFKRFFSQRLLVKCKEGAKGGLAKVMLF